MAINSLINKAKELFTGNQEESSDIQPGDTISSSPESTVSSPPDDVDICTEKNLSYPDQVSYASDAQQLATMSASKQSQEANICYPEEISSQAGSEEAFFISERNQSPYVNEYEGSTITSPSYYEPRTSEYGFEVSNPQRQVVSNLYARADHAVQSHQEKIAAEYQQKTQDPGWYQKDQWVYSSERGFKKDKKHLANLNERIAEKSKKVQANMDELVDLTGEAPASLEANASFLEEKIKSTENLNNELITLQNERNALNAKQQFYLAQKQSTAYQREITTGMDEINAVMLEQERSDVIDPYVLEEGPINTHTSDFSGLPPQGLPEDVNASFDVLNDYISRADSFDPSLAADLRVQRARLYDQAGAFDRADLDLSTVGTLDPSNGNLARYQTTERPEKLEAVLHYYQNQVNDLEAQGVDDLEPRQVQKTFYLQRMNKAQQALGYELYPETPMELADAQAWAKRYTLQSQLQDYAKRGILTTENAHEFGLSSEQMDQFFTQGQDENGKLQLQYSQYLLDHPEIQDEKLPKVLGRLDQRQKNIASRQVAEEQANPYKKAFYAAGANYQEGMTENKPHLVNLAELQLDDFLSETQGKGPLSPQLEEMRQAALAMSRQIGLNKVAKIRQLSKLHHAGVELHDGGASKSIRDDIYAGRSKNIDTMEKALTTGVANSFDEASELLRSRKMDSDLRNWVAFHRIHPNARLSEKGDPNIPSVSERLSPEAQQSGLAELSLLYPDNREVFVDRDISREKIMTSKAREKALGNEEAFVAQYKQEKLRDLMQENDYAGMGEGGFDDETGEYASSEMHPEMEYSDNNYFHDELNDFVRKNNRRDLDFPREADNNNRPEEYNAVLEAMAREAWAQESQKETHILEQMANSPDVQRYNDEFDPHDEWFNLQRGTGTLIVKEGIKMAPEMAAGAVLSAGVGSVVSGFARGYRAYRLQRNYRNMQNIAKGAEAFRDSTLAADMTAAGMSRTAQMMALGSNGARLGAVEEFGLSAMKKGADMFADLGFTAATGNPIGITDVLLSGMGNPFGRGKRAAKEAAEEATKAGTRSMRHAADEATDTGLRATRRRAGQVYNQRGPNDIRREITLTEAQYDLDPGTWQLLDISGKPIPGTRENALKYSKVFDGEVGIIHMPGEKPYLVTSQNPGFVGSHNGHSPKGHTHNPPFRIVDRQGNDIGLSLTYAPSGIPNGDVGGLRGDIARGARKPNAAEYIHAETPQGQATTYAYKPISDSQTKVFYKVPSLGNQPFAVTVDDDDLTRLGNRMEDLLQDPNIQSVDDVLPVLRNEGFEVEVKRPGMPYGKSTTPSPTLANTNPSTARNLHAPTSKAESEVWKGLEPYDGPTRSNGEKGKKRRFYEWDHTHGDIEVYDRNGNHLGSMDAETGELTKPAVPGRILKRVRKS